jgi:hypothetical protein
MLNVRGWSDPAHRSIGSLAPMIALASSRACKAASNTPRQSRSEWRLIRIFCLGELCDGSL